MPTAEAPVAETMAGIHREPPTRADCLPKKPPPRPTSCARSWRRSRTTSGACATARSADQLRGRAAPRRACRRFGSSTLRRARARPPPHPAALQGRARRQTGRGRLPYGTTALCPVRALRSLARRPHHRRAGVPAHLDAARRGKGRAGPPPLPVIGRDAIDPGSVARIVQRRAAAAGFDAAALGGHSLKRGALTTGMDAVSTRPGSSGSAGTRAMPCSTNIWSSATCSRAIR